ncbi:MAG: hypothetical protein K9K21_11665 [Desulfotignum sp.]|nr:hypothetical protein [Desulfotignum sp.]MCF8114496.1 hypothetical protein [Desulfotignum sp.]MCF8126672.1 hypothetical protein [Desulfotignum sp.]
MILHDFTYEWDGKSRSGRKPVSWWPGCYRVRIIQLGNQDRGIKYLFPFAVVFRPAKTDAAMNTSLENYIHNFAEKISEQYHLDMTKVLWIKMGDPVMVARLKPDRKLSDETFYAISWRPVRPNEMAAIEPDIKDF